MKLDFTKIHGAGNDFIMVDDLSDEIELTPEQVQHLCDRHFGIGADGVILIRPSKHADCAAFMDYRNSDGTLAEMCGNGVRCFAKYLVDKGFVQASDGRFIADTLAGKRPINFEVDGKGQLIQATVDMGEPAFAPERIPTTLAANTTVGHVAVHPDGAESGEAAAPLGGVDPSETVVAEALVETPIGTVQLTCVSMGNPHAVVFLDCLGSEVAAEFVADPHSFDISAVGPFLETHPLFPQKVNAEFAVVARGSASNAQPRVPESTQTHAPAHGGMQEGTHAIIMRVWERGVGETLACGTGACATAVAAMITGRLGDAREVTLKLLGGDLYIQWHPNNHVLMTGPATTVYEGSIEL
jgi:diaminopimelate epimerase